MDMARTTRILIETAICCVIANYGFQFFADRNYGQAFDRSFFQSLVIAIAIFNLRLSA
jgi:hypothetical protein